MRIINIFLYFLTDNTKIDPQQFTEDSVIEIYKEEYMFFGCLKFITEVTYLRVLVKLVNIVLKDA
jgi:hypothetical protein